MPGYRVELTATAEQVLERIARRESHLYRRLAAAIDDLAVEPLAGKPLKGALAGRRSLRVGTYRIVYRVEHDRLLVLVIDVGHRRDIYR